MSEKVKLPKAVCDALDEIISNEFIPSEIVVRTFNAQWKEKIRLVLNSFDVEIIMRALVLGYEPEMTPEEQLKFVLTKVHDKNIDYKSGAWYALKVHGIKYEWLEGDAE